MSFSVERIILPKALKGHLKSEAAVYNEKLNDTIIEALCYYFEMDSEAVEFKRMAREFAKGKLKAKRGELILFSFRYDSINRPFRHYSKPIS